MVYLQYKLMMIILAAAAVLGLGATSALANAFCDSQVAAYRGELEAKVSPAIKEIDNGIADIRNHGGDPDKIAFKTEDGSFKTLPQLRSLLLTQKTEVSKQIDDATTSCANELKPFQDATDAAVTIATGGLNKLLPERMTHIEIGEILAGKPLGGDWALIPHFREQILAALGLTHDNGFFTNFLRDPLRCALGIRKC
jgi:hypothetical protein